MEEACCSECGGELAGSGGAGMLAVPARKGMATNYVIIITTHKISDDTHGGMIVGCWAQGGHGLKH